ncbi:unnamed protein product, partial [Timema podura]|nr:unnamed protein product [Timema podura]
MEASSHFSESEGNEKRHEVLIKDEIKIEPEMDLEPPEYISVAVKSEIPDSFEPESSCAPLPVKQMELIQPEHVDVTVKTEVLEGFVPESPSAPHTDKQQRE